MSTTWANLKVERVAWIIRGNIEHTLQCPLTIFGSKVIFKESLGDHDKCMIIRVMANGGFYLQGGNHG